MPSKTPIQQLQFSKFLESRKKLDASHPIKRVTAEYMKNATGMILQNNDNSSGYNSQSDSRNSLAWDNAFFTSPGILDSEELFGTLNFREMEQRVEMPGIIAFETFERERTSNNSEFNSRRSLAWDSAFFTSAGVLDPEELSLVNKGFKADLNPGNEEKNRRSTGSDCTINGDNCSIESLEIDLFDDLKASLRMSSNASNVATSNSEQGKGNNLQNTDSLNKSDASSRVRIKSTPASRRQNVGTNGSKRIEKATYLPPLAQSKMLGRVNSPSKAVTKRAPSCSEHTKLENNATKAASGQHMTISKRACLGNTYSVIPESTTSHKSPSSGSHTSRNESSCDLSKSAGESSLKSLRGKFDPRMSASCILSPWRYSFGNKIELQNSSLPLPSVSSPMSAEFSTSINQISDNSIESLDSSTPCRGITLDVDVSQTSNPESRYYDQRFTHENRETRFRNQQVNKMSTGNSSVLTDISGKIKPSGLRMPSARIGFFDAENSVELTPKGDLKYRSGAQPSCSKTRNRATRIKLQSAGDSLRTVNPKLLSPLGIMASHPEIMQNRKNMKREPFDSLRANKQALEENEDSDTHSSENILQMLNEEDEENLCNYHNQVDALTKHTEAIDLDKDLVIELKKQQSPSQFQFGTKNPKNTVL